MKIETIGIIGYGNLGKLAEKMSKRFLPGREVRIFDSHVGLGTENFRTPEEVAKSDIVFLSVPMSEYENVIRALLPLLGEQTVLGDLASVKRYTKHVIEMLAPNQPAIFTHPMFGPQAYANRNENVEGFPWVFCGHTDALPKEEYETIMAAARTKGFDVKEMSAEEHDRYAANTLYLTHRIAQEITEAGFTDTPINTLSFNTLMDSVKMVRPDITLFAEFRRYNPDFCDEVDARLHAARIKIDTEVLNKDASSK